MREGSVSRPSLGLLMVACPLYVSLSRLPLHIKTPTLRLPLAWSTFGSSCLQIQSHSEILKSKISTYELITRVGVVAMGTHDLVQFITISRCFCLSKNNVSQWILPDAFFKWEVAQCPCTEGRIKTYGIRASKMAQWVRALVA